MQYTSSISHKINIATGLSIIEHYEHGSGDNAISFIRYSDNSVWMFDNGSATKFDLSHNTDNLKTICQILDFE